MNFESLKLGFKEYLRKNMDLAEERYKIDTEGVSIFMYAGEFQNYLRDELNCDISDIGTSFSKLSKMEIKDGKLVDPKAEEKDSKKKEHILSYQNGEFIFNDRNSSTDNEEIINDDAVLESGEIQLPTAEDEIDLNDMELVTNIINDLLQDDEFKLILDLDEDGVETSEIMAFFKAIKDKDGNKNDVSLTDIVKTTDEIEKGEFEIKKDEVDRTNEPESTQGAGGSGGSYGGGGVSGTGSNTPAEKTLEQMSPEEIQVKIDEEQAILDENKELLVSVADGSNPEMQAEQKKVDDAYDEYLKKVEEIAPELAEEIDSKKQKIDEQEKLIAENDVKIIEQEQAVVDAESTLNSAKSKLTNYQAIQGALEGELSGADEESKAEIQAKLSEIKKQVSAAEEEVAKAEETLAKQKEELANLKETKEEYTQQRDLLVEEFNEFQELHKEELAGAEELKNTWTEMKTDFENSKQQAVEEINKVVAESQQKISELQQAKTEAENKQTQQEYLGADGQAVVDFAKEFLKMSEGQVEQICGYDLPDGLWCAAFCKYALTQVHGEGKLPDWYKNCNTNYCPSILDAAKNNNALYTDPADARPGDLILFSNGSRASHIGIVDRVENGVVYTVEGNTSSRVDERQYDAGSGKIIGYVRVVD